jgi:hypothetical protein
MIEDPLIGSFVMILMLPLGLVLGDAVSKFNFEIALLSLVCIVLLALFLFLPLVIWRQKKVEKEGYNVLRKESIVEEKDRRQKSWELKQKRANRVIDAKVNNLEAQTMYLQDQSDRFEKFLLEQSAKEIGASVQANFNKIRDVETVSFKEGMKAVLESFKAIDKKYDHLIDSFGAFEKSLEILSKEEALVEPKKVNIEVRDQVEDPIEQAPEPLVKDESMRIEIDSGELQPLGTVKVTVKPTPGGDSEEILVDEAMKAIESLDDGTKDEILSNGIMTELSITEPIPVVGWDCHRCSRNNADKVPRCPTCSLSQAASRELTSKDAEIAALKENQGSD